MSRSDRASARSELPADLASVFGCVRDELGRRRVTSALRGVAETTWFDSFGELRAALESLGRHVVAVVLDMQDPTGASAETFAAIMRDAFSGIGVVAYAKPGSHSQA